MMQDNDQSQKNIDLAEQVLAYRNNVIESSNCQLNTTSIIAQRGGNSVLLQDYANALDLLNRGLHTYAPSLLRGRARLIGQKAEAYYELGCIDESISAAQGLLALPPLSVLKRRSYVSKTPIHYSINHITERKAALFN